jgi:hypothetical protein
LRFPGLRDLSFGAPGRAYWAFHAGQCASSETAIDRAERAATVGAGGCQIRVNRHPCIASPGLVWKTPNIMNTPLVVLIAVCTLSTASLAAGVSGWVNLFDGKSLNGWTQKNGTATYRAEDGMIIGKTTEGSPNSFLCTDTSYADFELEFDVKVDPGLNSGVQIRSKTKERAERKGKSNEAGRVCGPQVEIESSGTKGAEAGYVYGEATGLGWLTPPDKLKPHKIFKDGEWNHYRVVAKGPRIQTWINGQPIEDIAHEGIYKDFPSGFIGLQVHGIKKGTGPFEVRWRNIRIEELK